MKACLEQTSEQIDAENTDWLRPIEILSENLSAHGLNHYIVPGLCNPDLTAVVDLYRAFPVYASAEHSVIHWLNEAYRYQKLDKNMSIEASLLDRLMQKHQIARNRIKLIDSQILTAFHPV